MKAKIQYILALMLISNCINLNKIKADNICNDAKSNSQTDLKSMPTKPLSEWEEFKEDLGDITEIIKGIWVCYKEELYGSTDYKPSIKERAILTKMTLSTLMDVGQEKVKIEMNDIAEKQYKKKFAKLSKLETASVIKMWFNKKIIKPFFGIAYSAPKKNIAILASIIAALMIIKRMK